MTGVCFRGLSVLCHPFGRDWRYKRVPRRQPVARAFFGCVHVRGQLSCSASSSRLGPALWTGAWCVRTRVVKREVAGAAVQHYVSFASEKW